MKRRVHRAFTLVEILIVVVILGILAAVVVPQFVNASDDAQAGNVDTQLQTLRTQIQLFAAQPGNDWPAQATLWTDLINAELIQDEPVNPRTGVSTVIAGDAAAAEADTTDGWTYDENTGELWANGYDEDWRTAGTDPWP